jgi:uncharacterized delta-60 repeat protein
MHKQRRDDEGRRSGNRLAAWLGMLVAAMTEVFPGAPTPDVPDPGFNAGENIAAGRLNAVATQSDDKVIVGGVFTSWNGQPRSTLVRLNPDGTLDSSFASLAWEAAEVHDLAVDAQDRIYVCGQWQTIEGAARPAVIRLNADGTLDAGYPSDARWLNNGKRLALLSDGSVIYNGNAAFLNGAVLESHAFLRLNPDGTANTDFSKRFADAGYLRAGAMLFAELPGGRLQLMGDPFKGGQNQRGVRFNLDGSPDPGWTTDITKSGLMTDIAIQADGGILVSGSFSSPNRSLIRVQPDGKVDPAFVAPTPTGNGSLVRLDRNGGIYWRDGSDFWKLGANGATNQDFKVDFDSGGPLDVAFDSKGRIVLVGTFQNGASRPDASVKFSHKRVIRLLGDAASGPVDPPAPKIPETFADLQNRVFLRTAPNGAEFAVRLLPGNTFEPATAYKTNRADYVRAGLSADHALLTLASTDTFGGVYSWQTNKFRLTFLSPTNGTYESEFTINTVPGVQTSTGPFSLTVGSNILPRITQQPSGGAFPGGQNITALSVGALGFGLKYQWYQNGSPVAGATLSSHAFVPMGADKVGDWFVVVTNELGAVTSQVAKVELASAPVITLNPQPASGFEGGSATFSVVASGAALNYEWLFNGRSAGYPNSPAITVSNLTAGLAGLYSVRVFNNAGSTTSAAVRLSVCAAGLEHTWQGRPWVKILRSGDAVPGFANTFGPLNAPFSPLFTLRDQTVHAIARANSEVADSPTPYTALVRWRDGHLATLVFTNTPLPGGNGNFTYPFYPTEEGDGAVNFQQTAMYEWRAGSITTILGAGTPVPGRPGATFGPSGSFARRGARVAISATIDLGLADANPAGLFFHDGSALTRIADDTTDLPGVMPGYAYRLTEDSVNYDGATIVFSTMVTANGPGGVYRATTDGGLTKLMDTGDLIPGVTNQVVSFGDVDVEGGAVFAVVGSVRQDVVQRRVLMFEADGTTRVLGFGDFLVASGPRQVYFGTSGSIQRWTDGVTETVINTQALLGCQRVKSFFDVEALGEDVAIGVEFADGTAAIYANFGEATPGVPRLLASPQSQTVPETAPATFSVAVSGPAPITYQWFKDGTPIGGATGATFTIFSTTPADVASYHVTVTAGGNVVTSPPAALSLSAPPVKPLIFVPPVNVAVPVGSPATLKVTAAGTGPLTYKWAKGATTVQEGPSSELAFAAAAPADHGTYTVVVSNAHGATPGYAATLSVTPRITQQPQAQTVEAGGTATFSVVATGFDDLRYLWFKGTTVLTGQTNATLRLENVQASDAGAYSVAVSGVGGGSLRSAAATLTVGGGGEPTEIKLGTPTIADGKLSFSLPTVAGETYDVQFKPSLSDAAWSVRETIVGDGTTKTVTVGTTGTAGFVRVEARR